jgi:hypothetical protein
MVAATDTTTPLTHEELLALVRYDPETGHFFGVARRQGVRTSGIPLGNVNNTNGYRRICIKGRRYLAHRLAFFYVTGRWPTECVDHKNRCTDDNRWDNLREATFCQNQTNRRQTFSNLKGAHWNRFRNKWQSYMRVNKKSHFLGFFPDEQSAHEAYVKAATEHAGEFARAT